MYISIDIGGTNTRVGISNNLTAVDEMYRFVTPDTFSKLQYKFDNIFTFNKNQVQGISVGVPGQVNRTEKRLLFAPNVTYLNNLMVTQILPGFFCSTTLENDATLAALAESNLGVAKGYKKVVYVTISTGVGGALILDGKIMNSALSSEPGHIILDRNIALTEINNILSGTLEHYCAGVTFKTLYGIEPEACEDMKTWENYGKSLGLGLINISILWQPDIIVLGGSITKKITYFLNHITNTLKAKLGKDAPEVKISTLDDTNVVLGGLIYIKQLAPVIPSSFGVKL